MRLSAVLAAGPAFAATPAQDITPARDSNAVQDSNSVTGTLHADQPGPQISRYLFGQFAEHLGFGVYGGIWVGEGSRILNIRGYGSDVIAALKQLEVPVVRWPGGCFADEYHWREGIGPRDKRPVRVNTHWGGVEETNAFGTHEFFDFAELIGADAYLAGNVGDASPDELAQWVEYITSDTRSALANERRANGRDKPWVLPFVGVGNELWGCGGNMRAEYAADVYRRYQTFVTVPDGVRVVKIAPGSHDADYHWTQVMMRDAGAFLHGPSLQYYTLDALVAALNLNIFSQHADRVKMANVAHLVNVLQAMIMTQDEKLLLTPTYHVFMMYKPFKDAIHLPLDIAAPSYHYGSYTVPAVQGAAARDAAGRIHVAKRSQYVQAPGYGAAREVRRRQPWRREAHGSAACQVRGDAGTALTIPACMRSASACARSTRKKARLVDRVRELFRLEAQPVQSRMRPRQPLPAVELQTGLRAAQSQGDAAVWRDQFGVECACGVEHPAMIEAVRMLELHVPVQLRNACRALMREIEGRSGHWQQCAPRNQLRIRHLENGIRLQRQQHVCHGPGSIARQVEIRMLTESERRGRIAARFEAEDQFVVAHHELGTDIVGWDHRSRPAHGARHRA
ncbi:MAG TPA: alpha-L-arabinofuranosidase C-terminal domain-containing protein [Steroidobacteraceae bacterium]|nr:alpha-L-arabinofuranosidase C-terminal domain-containing protein [Steroidobacteraceae bacterium]